MELLQKIDDRGYPTEYLLSRIRGRRVSLITDWEPLIFGTVLLESLISSRYKGFIAGTSPESEWRHLLMEFRWVYLQMNKNLWVTFWPFFLYSELRTLFFCLRYKSANESTAIERILTYSLLSKGFKKVLKQSEDTHNAVKGVEDFFISLSAGFRGIKGMFMKDGLKGVEQGLTKEYLEYIVNLKLHPAVKKFFIRIIDSRNIITLYKHLRWDIKAVPDFIKGGGIGESKLKGAMDKGNIFDVTSIIHALTGIAVEKPDAASVENSLYKGMTRFLKREGREPSGVGLILDYLWRCSVEVRNLGILLHGEDIDRDTIKAELIQ